MTVSHGTPSAAAAAAISDDLPMPGSPHRQTATPARPAARRTVTRLVALVTATLQSRAGDRSELQVTDVSGWR
jgi:hypothetical protein